MSPQNLLESDRVYKDYYRKLVEKALVHLTDHAQAPEGAVAHDLQQLGRAAVHDLVRHGDVLVLLLAEEAWGAAALSLQKQRHLIC